VDAWTAPEIVEEENYQRMLGNKHGDWHYYKFNQGSWCYLNKLLPIVPYTICGVLWYQGESNRLEEEAVHYDKLLDKMIANWRDLWQKELPFYIVQIAPHNDGDWNDWAHIRRCQEFVTHFVPDTYLCTLAHTGEADNIHPTKKHQIATELKNAVLANAFGYDVEYCGPVVDKAEKTEDGAVITFSHAAGLHFDGDPADLQVYNFERNPIPYVAAIEGNALRVTADGIFRITMGFCNSPTHNLYNAAGCLASPFELIL
jgi:sialate O-acetylesterase